MHLSICTLIMCPVYWFEKFEVSARFPGTMGLNTGSYRSYVRYIFVAVSWFSNAALLQDIINGIATHPRPVKFGTAET